MRKFSAFLGGLLLASMAGVWAATGGKLGNETVTLATLLAGEDQTNGVMKVEGQYSRCLATADTVCKATVPAFVHAVWCYGVDAAATAGRVRLVDDATVTGTAANEIWGAEFAAAIQPPIGQVIDQVMVRGIEFDFTTTADVTCVVSYR